MFSCLYMFSFFFVINSDDWFMIWLGMEINMMSFIFLIYMRNSMNNIESCFKYFFIQSLGSAIFMSFFYMNQGNYMFIGSIILSLKMGGGPFYFWFPSISSGISWYSFYLLMSFQKIIPLMLLMFFISWIMWVIIFTSLLFGVMGSFNQMNMKRLMAFSSVHHMGWMLICGLIDNSIWMIYLFMYMVLMIPLIYIFSIFEINKYLDISKCNSKWWFVLMMMNIGGMPPMLGFFLKWMGFYYITDLNYLYIFVMIILSAIMFYIYLRLSYDILLEMMKMESWMYKNSEFLLKFLFDFVVIFGLIIGFYMSYMFMY